MYTALYNKRVYVLNAIIIVTVIYEHGIVILQLALYFIFFFLELKLSNFSAFGKFFLIKILC